MADDLLWDITYKCNLRCQHCYNANRLSSQQETLLDNYQMESIVNKIKNLGIKHIHMLGGEPLCVQVLPDLINELYKEGISISINTNATLLNKSLINIILQKVDQLTISLDGMEADNDLVRGKGVFNIVCRNLYLLTDMKKQLNSKTKLHIAIVANSRNYSTLHKFPQLVSELNVNSIMLMRLYECSDSNIDYSKLRLSNKQYLDILPRFLFNCYKYNIDLKIDCKPSVLDYLKRKMGINIDSQEKFNICQGGGGLYIWMQLVTCIHVALIHTLKIR